MITQGARRGRGVELVGSTNFDNRSFGLNDEVNLAAYCPELAGRLEEDFARDVPGRQVNYLAWRRRPLRARHELLGWLWSGSSSRGPAPDRDLQRPRSRPRRRTRPGRIVDVLRESRRTHCSRRSCRGRSTSDKHRRAISPTRWAQVLRGENASCAAPLRQRGAVSLPDAGGENYDLSVEGFERRGCLQSTSTSAARWCSVHVHLAPTNRAAPPGRRLTDMEILRNEQLTGPRIMLGDFTSGAGSRRTSSART